MTVICTRRTVLGMQVSPEEALEVVRCGGRGQLYWPADHQCHDPLSQGPCAASQLLVLDPASLTAKCGDQLQCVHSEEGVEDGDLVWDGTQCIDVGSILYSVIIHSQLFIRPIRIVSVVVKERG